MAKKKGRYGGVDWYEEDALFEIDQASDDIVTRIAFQVEGYAKVAAKVDTGFMRNTIYTIPASYPPTDTGWEDGAYESSKTGESEQRFRVDVVPKLPPRFAAVHAAAEYAIYREVQDHFLYNALEKAKGIAPGVIRGAGRRLSR